MRFSDAQLREFDEQGVLLVPELFSADEIARLNAELPSLMAVEGPKVLGEQNSEAVRSVIAPHHNSALFSALSRHPRIVQPAMQYLSGDVYMHQFKVNTKAAHDGEIWHWHQDYRTWYEDDGMPEPNVVNAAIFLDDVTEFNGPMMLIPGSHRRGRIDATESFERVPEYGRLAADAVGSPYSHALIDALIEEHGLVSAKGVAGSCLFFHGCTLHGSPPNMSPWSRNLVFASLNHVDNYLRAPTRPDFLALRDFSAIECLQDDCLSDPLSG